MLRQKKFRVLTAIFGYLVGFLQTYIPLGILAILVARSKAQVSLGDTLAIVTNASIVLMIFRRIGKSVNYIKYMFEKLEKDRAFVIISHNQDIFDDNDNRLNYIDGAIDLA